jgi:hypothetical protein
MTALQRTPPMTALLNFVSKIAKKIRQALTFYRDKYTIRFK